MRLPYPKAMQIAIQFSSNDRQASNFDTFDASSFQQCSDPRAQGLGLYFGRRERRPRVQAHPAEKPSPERPDHGRAFFDAAEKRSPEVGQRHGHNGHLQAVALGVFQDLDRKSVV